MKKLILIIIAIVIAALGFIGIFGDLGGDMTKVWCAVMLGCGVLVGVIRLL